MAAGTAAAAAGVLLLHCVAYFIITICFLVLSSLLVVKVYSVVSVFVVLGCLAEIIMIHSEKSVHCVSVGCSKRLDSYYYITSA